MTYTRVIPRDLFNEANLLKCYGQLCLKLEDIKHEYPVELVGPPPGQAFCVEQDESDGSTHANNVRLRIFPEYEITLYRPLNSRDAWPLYASCEHGEAEVFGFNGVLSDAFLALLRAAAGKE